MSDSGTKAQLAMTPGPGIDPMAALASSMHASRGLYAMLVGSGVSRSAGQPSAWEILEALIKSYAAAKGVDLVAESLQPTEWWEQSTGVPAGYSWVLERLEPTRGGRQERLATYFEANTPSSAHRKLANLCASGKVQVVLTTNFDRLIEQALNEAGLHYQVVDQHTVTGMMPLVRGQLTVIKVNGDYLSLAMKNTARELARYTRPLTATLREVLRDFGLVVVGWSGQWDTALCSLLHANSARNYPMYWVAHEGNVCEDADRLIDNRGAHKIASAGADEFFSDLVSRLDRLYNLALHRTSRRRALRNDGRYLPDQHNPVSALASRDIWIRTVATLGPASAEETGYIDPHERRSVIGVLDAARITSDLRSLGIMGGVFAGGPYNGSPFWEVSEEDHLTRDTVGFRLCSAGRLCDLSGRLWLESPAAFGGAGGDLLAIFDIGVGKLKNLDDSQRKLTLEEVVRILVDQLSVQAKILSETLAHLTPNNAGLQQVEFHLYTPRGAYDNSSRHVDDYVDFSSLGSGRSSERMSASFALSEPVTARHQFDLVIEAVKHITLSLGFQVTENEIARLKNSFSYEFRD